MKYLHYHCKHYILGKLSETKLAAYDEVV